MMTQAYIHVATGNKIYLVIKNRHNGYYHHGFEMGKDGTIEHRGSV